MRITIDDYELVIYQLQGYIQKTKCECEKMQQAMQKYLNNARGDENALICSMNTDKIVSKIMNQLSIIEGVREELISFVDKIKIEKELF